MAAFVLVAGIVFFVLVAGVCIIKRWLSQHEDYAILTKHGKCLIYDAELSKGVHDHLYALGHALVSNAIFLESSTSLNSRDIRNGLEMLTKRYPMLRMKFDWIKSPTSGKTTHRYLTEMDNPCDRIEFADEDLAGDLWPRRLEEELHRAFDGSTGPLWRVVRLKEQCNDARTKFCNTLLFTYHHSISDALSVLALFDRLLEFLDTGVESEVESMPLLPSLPDLIQHETTLSWWEACLFKLKWVRLMKPQPANNIYLQAFPPVVKRSPISVQKTCVIPRKLTKEQTSQLIQHCKTNRCTVTAAFMAATAIAVSKLIQGGEIKSELTIQMGTAVNIRDYCRPVVNREHFGCFVSFCLVELQLPEIHSLKVGFWRSAQELTATLKSRLKNKEHLTVYKMLKYHVLDPVQDFTELSGDFENMGRRASVSEFSNIGRFECKTRQHKVLGYHFAVAQHLCGALFSNSIVTVNDQLFHTLVYSNHVVSHSQAEEFIDLVYQILGEVCSS